VAAIKPETPRVKSFRLRMPHLPGQHYDVRLTAPDGYSAQRSYSIADMRLVYSARTGDDLIYAGELGEEAVVTYTREPPAGWTGHTGRLDAELIGAAARGAMTAYVCGSNGFVETASRLLLDAGLEPAWIRTERFGPTG
jgi:ferredoxin-NADP reductase